MLRNTDSDLGGRWGIRPINSKSSTWEITSQSNWWWSLPIQVRGCAIGGRDRLGFDCWTSRIANDASRTRDGSSPGSSSPRRRSSTLPRPAGTRPARRRRPSPQLQVSAPLLVGARVSHSLAPLGARVFAASPGKESVRASPFGLSRSGGWMGRGHALLALFNLARHTNRRPAQIARESKMIFFIF
jgi:hypothetical protein